jgi:hypothetical protein
MSITPHDQFAKQFLEELLSPFGILELNREVLGEARFIDLWFQPHPHPQPNPIDLGFLGQIAQSPSLIEPYRNPINTQDIESCLTKRFALKASLERKSQTTREPIFPLLWILAPTVSVAILNSFGAISNPTFLPGIYTLPPALGTHIIILHQLPPIPQTLWLRLLARGKFQKRAIQEVLALPAQDTRRDLALRLLVNWKIALETIPSELQAEEDLFMALTQAYLEWEQRTRNEGEQRGIEIGEQRGIEIGEQRGIEIGEQRGIQRGQQLVRSTLENLFTTRFGQVDVNLEAVIETFLGFSTEEYNQNFPAALTDSYDRLIEQFTDLS